MFASCGFLAGLLVLAHLAQPAFAAKKKQALTHGKCTGLVVGQTSVPTTGNSFTFGDGTLRHFGDLLNVDKFALFKSGESNGILYLTEQGNHLALAMPERKAFVHLHTYPLNERITGLSGTSDGTSYLVSFASGKTYRYTWRSGPEALSTEITVREAEDELLGVTSIHPSVFRAELVHKQTLENACFTADDKLIALTTSKEGLVLRPSNDLPRRDWSKRSFRSDSARLSYLRMFFPYAHAPLLVVEFRDDNLRWGVQHMFFDSRTGGRVGDYDRGKLTVSRRGIAQAGPYQVGDKEPRWRADFFGLTPQGEKYPLGTWQGEKGQVAVHPFQNHVVTWEPAHGLRKWELGLQQQEVSDQETTPPLDNLDDWKKWYSIVQSRIDEEDEPKDIEPGRLIKRVGFPRMGPIGGYAKGTPLRFSPDGRWLLMYIGEKYYSGDLPKKGEKDPGCEEDADDAEAYSDHLTLSQGDWLLVDTVSLNPIYQLRSTSRIRGLHLEGFTQDGNWLLYKIGGKSRFLETPQVPSDAATRKAIVSIVLPE